MPTNNGYYENDVVRVTRALSGKDPYTGRPVSIPTGEEGTIIVGKPGYDSYDVEFIMNKDSDWPHSAVLIVAIEDTELVWKSPA